MPDQKTQRILLPSAARTVATACPKQNDSSAQFVRLYLNITAASGTGGLKAIIRGYDKVSGLPVNITAGGAAAIIATGLYVYELVSSGNVAVSPVLESIARFLPVVWDVNVTVGDASSYTYSLSADIIPPG
jgi:hypothetical protein